MSTSKAQQSTPSAVAVKISGDARLLRIVSRRRRIRTLTGRRASRPRTSPRAASHPSSRWAFVWRAALRRTGPRERRAAPARYGTASIASGMKPAGSAPADHDAPPSVVK